MVGAAQLLREIATYLKTESADHDAAQLRLICDLAQAYVEKAREDIRQLQKVVRDFDQTCRTLSMSGMGLELVRVTGQIELARIPQSSEGSALLGSLRHFQESLTQGLERILDRNDLIDDAVKSLLVSVARPTQEA